MMKIVMGSPIHESKGYCINAWLDSVKAIDWPGLPLIISDNSDSPDFRDRVQAYCDRIGLPVEVDHRPGMRGLEPEARRVQSREWFRNRILEMDVDAWLSWECDILVEPAALRIMAQYLEVVDIVMHTYPDRDDPQMIVGGIGFALFKREILERLSFLTGGGYAMCNPEKPSCYYSGDSWLLQRAIGAGFRSAEFTQLIQIQHPGR